MLNCSVLFARHLIANVTVSELEAFENMKLPSSGMLRRVALVRTDVLEERIASIISVTNLALNVSAYMAIILNK
jgi:hypothetical protein